MIAPHHDMKQTLTGAKLVTLPRIALSLTKEALEPVETAGMYQETKSMWRQVT